MGKSVKLTDGSYIDSAGVWSNTQGDTIESLVAKQVSINAGQTNINESQSGLNAAFSAGVFVALQDLSAAITAAGISEAGSSYASKQGRIASLTFYVKAPKAYTANTTIFTVPEAYRPMVDVNINSQGLTGEQRLVLQSDGAIVTAKSIANGTWMLGNVTYLTN